MEVYLKMEFNQWFNVTKGYKAPMDSAEIPMDPNNWNMEMKKKAQVDFKFLNTIQCGLTKEELNRVDPQENAKEIWDKLIELHEWTNDAKEGETVSQLHSRIKDILNGLHTIGHQIENRDLIRYAVNVFPRNAL
ncbi:uncharacterized protein LOC122043745 [Zingiber officinale]|uniref:uncharacterized protein LOC122043745 n=1 Tax=Zingiber officinale TaxID=94328 RepID=UPI001C4BB8D8|nr:uncharacterized protein LOC122043745 [Zingiber officinale]